MLVGRGYRLWHVERGRRQIQPRAPHAASHCCASPASYRQAVTRVRLREPQATRTEGPRELSKVNAGRDDTNARTSHQGGGDLVRICEDCAESWTPPPPKILYCLTLLFFLKSQNLSRGVPIHNLPCTNAMSCPWPDEQWKSHSRLLYQKRASCSGVCGQKHRAIIF